METPEFKTAFEPAHGSAVQAAPDILRVTANNPGPFTFHGTNSYVAGRRSVAVIDPGPDDEAHLRVLLEAIGGRDVSHILVTHTHVDHSPLAARLKQITGAPVLAQGPHRPARPLNLGEINALDASADRDFMPDIALAHRDLVEAEDFTFEAVHTPGHTANHMAFAIAGQNLLFSGDHVMAWATSIVAPPDGAMSDYMASLDTLLARAETLYLPGHGGPVTKAHEFVRALRAHRRMRESAILGRVRAGDRTIGKIVSAIYKDTDPRLHGAAALSVLAHMEDLLASGRIISDGPASLAGHYEPAPE
jgi:glyoxylase-like metal-dependent hydrolase (beta-lactamase superfamily II)